MVKDPTVAEKLVPVDHPFTSKRPLIDTNYFDTYNRDNVTLVDIRHAPIQEITPTGIRTDRRRVRARHHRVRHRLRRHDRHVQPDRHPGPRRRKLKDKWAHGPLTYLGVAERRLPEPVHDHRPGLAVGASATCRCRSSSTSSGSATPSSTCAADGLETMEADQDAETEWVAHVNEIAAQTMFMLADSWYLGANIPGKPRCSCPTPGGVGTYRQKCDEVRRRRLRGLHAVDAPAPVAGS